MKRKEVHFGDRIFAYLLRGFAMSLPFLLLAIIIFLYLESRPALQQYGFSFLWSQTWDPVRSDFGAAAFVFGTLISSLIAIVIAAPASIMTALFLSEIASHRVAGVAGFLVEMLAAIPSVVYGLWGIYVLAPFMRETIEPFLGHWFGFLFLFQGPPYGVGMLTAGLVLAIMIIPTITTVSREVFLSIPRSHREAAMAIGATRWEVMRLSVLKSGKSGVLGAIILGLGRALGETMAVTMVIGNRPEISFSLFSPAQTMSSVLANEYAEASSRLHLSALMELGLLLFFVTFIVNACGRLFVWRSSLGGQPR